MSLPPPHHQHLFSVAPMMGYTNKHFRYFFRLLSKKSFLYTEMITAQALCHGHKTHLLEHSPQEHPMALQIGGSDPKLLAKAAYYGQLYGYQEINLNVGCPSHKVQTGKMGACLMAEPKLVAKCIQAMQYEVTIPITIKHRIGIKSTKLGNYNSYLSLKKFIDLLAKYNCNCFIIHARIAILEGLNPKENRQIPPIDYHTIYKIKEEFPELEIILNGEIKTLNEAKEHLNYVDGVMVGREAYKNPYVFYKADTLFNTSTPSLSRYDIAKNMTPYLQEQMDKGLSLPKITRHMFGLFKGLKNSKKLKNTLNQIDTIEDYQLALDTYLQ